MRKIKYLFIFFVAILASQKVSAQINPIKQFTEDPIKFLEDVKTMFEVTNMDKKEIHAYM